MNSAYFDNPNLHLVWKYISLPFGTYSFAILPKLLREANALSDSETNFLELVKW